MARGGMGEVFRAVAVGPDGEEIPVAIKRGENRNRTVTYHNIARRWIKVGTWTGVRQRWTVPESELKADGIDSVAVVVQAGGMEKPGVVLGAEVISLR